MFDGVVLGIDPGLSRCGYGAVRREGSALRPVAAGVVRTPPSDSLPDRLAALEAELEAIVAEVHPTAMAVERVLFQVNVRTAMSVGQASGIALAVASRARVPVTHYSPNEVKLAVVGYGAATKEQVQVMITRLLSLPEILEPPDAADALALALCHASSAGLRAAGAAAVGASTGAGGGSSRLDAAVAAAMARDARGSR